MLALALVLPIALAAKADGESADLAPADRVVIAVLPYGTTVEEIAAQPEFAPGVVSAGLGAVAVAQTFLDIAQGNRINETLYDGDLPNLYVRDGRVPPRIWRRALARADGAPANVTPGLLASTLEEAEVPVVAEADSGLATLIAVDRDGAVEIASDDACSAGCGPGLSVMRTRLVELPAMLELLGPNDLLIALAAGARGDQVLLPVGFAGRGFEGNVTSASTRTDGVITTTDLGPTILEALGVDVPDQMNGAEVTSGDERDPQAVADLQEQLDSRPSREPVALLPLAIWIGLCLLAAAIWRRRGAREALRLLAPACAFAPALLLVAAAFDFSTVTSALTLGVGSVALAFAATRLIADDYAALAFACAISVSAYAIDVVLGSPLTSLSVLGPNPGYGVRFFGIGNELEAILTALTLIGSGAGLAALGSLSRRAAAIGFLVIGALAAAAFAPGRFGADVGAAIVLGVGASTAAVLALELERKRAIAVVVIGGIAGLAVLVLIDLVLGGAHLSRTVIGAGGSSDLLDVIERRLRLMSDTFIHPVYPELLAIVSVLLIAGFVRRATVRSWFGTRWPARCGFLGALVGILVGAVANDSGSVLLVLGSIYVAVAAGFFWATADEARVRTRGLAESPGRV